MLLRERPDVRIALGLLDQSQVEPILRDWVGGFASLAGSREDLIRVRLPALIRRHRPDDGGEHPNLKMGVRIAKGGFGEVWKGTLDGRPVVSKVMWKDSPQWGMFAYEALNQAQGKDNPHWPRIDGVFINQALTRQGPNLHQSRVPQCECPNE